MVKIIPKQIIRALVQLEEQHQSLLLVWSVIETSFIYDQLERLNSGHMNLDSVAGQVRSEDCHKTIQKA
jgi:hypothetical protein